VDDDGGAWCWGMSDHGALGHAGDSDSGLVVDGAALPSNPTPTRIEGIPGQVLQIALYDGGGCALTGTLSQPRGPWDGRVYCWGWNADGELGTDGGTDSPTPVNILWHGAPLDAVTEIWGGHATLCARQKYAGIYCWGSNVAGQLGLGADASPTQAAPIPFGPQDTRSTGNLDVAIGWGHVCVLPPNGMVWCAGWNGEYELGWGLRTDSDAAACAHCLPTPVPVLGPAGVGGPLTHVVQLSAGWASTCARTDDGLVYCWGYNGDATSRGATGHTPGTLGDVPCAPPPFVASPSGEAGAFCTPLPTVVSGLGPVQ
jgi:alpha-tubulin suppressor-like RCC1 family protein